MLERAGTNDQRLPAPVPVAAKAAVSPSALILAGGGVVVGVVVGLPVLAAAAVGACLWGIRIGSGAALAAARRSRAARPEMIDPYAVPEPWRGFVRESLTAQAKFDQAVARSRPGPLQDHLGAVSVRVHDGTRECWRVAHLGAALDAELTALNPHATSDELRRFQLTRPRSAVRAEYDTEAALAAQLQAAQRVQAAAQRTNDRLRVLTAQLHAAVAGAVELALDGAGSAPTEQLRGNVESVVAEIEALRRALEEVGTPGRTGSRPR